MEHYLSFSAGDFARDEEFLKWVKYAVQDPSLDARWKKWLDENPNKKEEVEEAKLLILAVTGEKQHMPGNEKQSQVWARIQETIGHTVPEEKIIPLWQRWYSKAAAVVVLIGAGWFVWSIQTDVHPVARTENSAGPLLDKQINNSDQAKTLILSDGTSIVLQPHSQLEYPKIFATDLREVTLTGEAFFEVQKDAKRPFMVRTNEIVTRVLGTSFTVRSFNEENNVVVQVKTGKVSVFKGKEKDTPGANESVEGVVLMPNQQVIYERAEGRMTKSLVENPSVLIPIAKQEFEFVDTPVKDVFHAIEQAYGVDIVYDEETFSACYLNASLDDVPLYDKLKLICKGIDASYEIMDSHILIYGKGCNE
jgi:ferric-dicitrate binding protein FerR (iron transport regulator)